jgi:DNA-binding NtrC family response regulator/PAS domain-containing protein
MTEQDKILNVAIVGGGPGCKAIMDVIFSEKLNALRMRLIGVADVNSKAVGYRYAQEKGIFTTQDYRELFKLKNLDLVVELTGRNDLANEIFRTKPEHVRLMGNVAARLFWDVFRIEEARLSERKEAERVLREDGRFLQNVFNAIQDGVTVIDCDYNIVRVNPWVERLGAFDKSLVGRKCYEAYHLGQSPCPWCPAVADSGSIGKGSSVVPLPGEGDSEIWIELAAFPLRNAKGDVIGIIEHMKEITQQKKAEKELERRHRELEAINAVLLRMTKEYNLDGMCRVLQAMMGDLYPGFEAWIFLLTPHRDGFYYSRPSGMDMQGPCYDRGQKKLRELELEDTLLEFLVAGKVGLVSSGKGQDHCPAVLQELVSNFSSWMAVPVEVDGQCYGLFVLGSSSVDVNMESELFFVEAVIRQVAGVIRYQISKEIREEAFREQLAGPDKFLGLVGRTQPMQKIYRMIQSVADSSSTVLITGESGTGKELVARAIRRAGKYKDTPFVVAHCSSFVPTLVHSEIFGHEKGAFTGAVSQKRGRLERAQGGILFLDEVADLPLETQVLLLRFLQDKSFERVGGEHLLEVNVRVIAATNKDIEKEMKAGRLREDFFYRLNVLPIEMPPLRERVADIPLLTSHFLKTYCLIEGKDIGGFDTDAMKLMMDYDWPGNVRELQNIVARCAVLAKGGHVGVEVLPERIRSGAGTTEYSLAKNERNLILRVMRECRWNKHEAARQLDISRGTLYSKLKKYGIKPASVA